MASAKYKKGKDGYYQAKVWDGTYKDGQKHRITLRTQKNSKELERLVNEHNQKIKDRDFLRDVDITFLDYGRKWQEVYKSGLSRNTLLMYNNVIEKHLCNVQCKIGDVNRMHYHMLINSISGDRTKQQVSMTFKQIVRSAVRDKLLPPGIVDDIFSDAVRIRYKAPEKRALTESEKKAIFSADLLPAHQLFLHILYGCGLRRGEALALTRFDINLERKELTVNKSLAFDGNTPYLKDTKTLNGERTIPIPDIILPTVENYISLMRGTLLFPSKSGEYMTKSSYIKMWNRIVKKMNEVSEEPIEHLTAHIFRHNFCASLCYAIPEISIRKVAELLGDTDRMVIEVYNHVIEEKERPHDTVTNALAL